MKYIQSNRKALQLITNKKRGFELKHRLSKPHKKRFDEIATSSPNDIAIYVCAHRNFTCLTTNKIYKVVTSKGVHITNTELDVLYEDGVPEVSAMQKAYGEFSRMYYLRHKVDLPKYVGICHYRRYFDFTYENRQIEDILENYDVIAHQNGGYVNAGTLYDMFKLDHDASDLDECFNIVKELYNVTDDEINVVKNSKMFGNNMVIMKRERYKKYVDFLYSVISKFNEHHNLKTDNDVYNYVASKEYIYKNKAWPTTRSLSHQSRLQGFLIERLTSLYILLFCKNVYCINHKWFDM